MPGLCTYVWGGKLGEIWGRVMFVFGDFKSQHWLPEIVYPTFNAFSFAVGKTSCTVHFVII